MYSLIENQLTDVMDRDELDQQKNLSKQWDALVENAFVVRDQLHDEQAEFKMQLILNIEKLVVDVHEFKKDFDTKGPKQPNLSPGEALNKLKDFKEQFSVLDRKYHQYRNGENLFGLPN